jgi:phage tail sheath gpL-like
MSVDATAVARVIGITTNFRNLRAGRVLYLPQHVGIVAQGSSDATYSLDKFQATSAGEVGNRLGFGSPAHLIAEQLFPANGDGVGTVTVTVHPLEDGYEAVAASGQVVASGSQTEASAYRARISGKLSAPFVIPVGATAAAIHTAMTTAINAVPSMPVTATDNGTSVGLTAKAAGEYGNDIVIEIIGDASLGTTFAITQPTGGLVNPAVTPALEQIGNVWESMLINGLNYDDTDALDEYQTFGVGRLGTLVKKRLVVFSGCTEADRATASTVAATRTTDRINCQINAPGSPNLPFVVAARAVARIARLANNNPPHDYGSQRLTGIIPGADSVQWDYVQRDVAVKSGVSTSEVRDGVVTLGDVVTYYRPLGEDPPADRYVVDIVKLQNIVFNFDLEFNQPAYDGAPLIPDDQPTVNRDAKKPSMIKGAAARIADNLGLEAIISNPAGAKETMTVLIDSQNPKRWNLRATFQLAGNSNIGDIDLGYGFYFGDAEIVA